MAVVSTLAVALRSHPYGETSLILRFYSRDLGLVGVIAKGARRRGKRGSGVPETFSRGVLTAYVKEGRNLHTMKTFDPDRARRELASDVLRFAAASVLGEILLRHAGAEESQALFQSLDEGLDALARVDPEHLSRELLARSWAVVREMGYLPDLAQCVRCGRALEAEEVGRFDLGAGGVRCSSCSDPDTGRRMGPGARAQLRGLLEGRSEGVLRKPSAHLRLLHDFAAYHLSEGRPLDAFRVYRELSEEEL